MEGRIRNHCLPWFARVVLLCAIASISATVAAQEQPAAQQPAGPNLPQFELPGPGVINGQMPLPERVADAQRGEPLELVEFKELPLVDAVRILSDQSGLKIVASADAGKKIINLYLRDVRPLVAIGALTKSHGLFYRDDVESGIVQIYTVEEYEKDLGSFREERTEVFTLLYPNPLEVAYAVRGTFGDRVLMTVNGVQVDQQQLLDLTQRFSKYNLLQQQNRISTGNNNTGNNNGNNNGGNANNAGAGGQGGQNNLGGGIGGFGIGQSLGGGGIFGGQFGQQQSRAGNAPTRLEDLTAAQIQALEKALTGSESLPIDDLLRSRNADIFVTAIPRNNQLVIRTADEQSMKRIRELIQHLDVPTPLVLLEVQVLALDLKDDFRSAFDYQWSDGRLTAGGFTNNIATPPPLTTGNILPPANDAGGLNRFESIAPGAAGANPNQNLTFQVVSANFRMRLQALESKSRVTQLATPLLLTANNEVSRIFIGSTVPIVTGFTQPIVVQNGVGGAVVAGAVPDIELRDIGQALLITPNINADRTVTLRVAQEQSSLGAQRTVTIPDGAGGVANGLVDVVNVTNVTGTVVAKDGLTVAIGGLIRENLTDTRAAVPILGKMPVVGIMFRNQVTGKTRDELIVMIRPYVFNTPQENAALSHDLVGELSLHPHAPNAQGTMNSFAPQEILTANPPMHPLQTIFRLHHLEPKIY